MLQEWSRPYLPGEPSLTPTCAAEVRVARVEEADYELKRAEAKALLAQGQAQLNLLLAGSRAEDIRRAEEQVKEARATARAAAADLDRTEKVFVGGSATSKQREEERKAEEEQQSHLAKTIQGRASCLGAGLRGAMPACLPAWPLAGTRLQATTHAC